ncbi:hypothetical protein PC129_g8728 [Phytophthora cactorum]|uniref:Uncharacterized protein n=2 Tax=Phytophthora cactorum TaxID=29920 RepID=A0A329SH82_9STRA|nr:hypothetical protein Pcac1_g9808 [Phytophthora cactorum]KAG2837577.1 hypothetical protein PC111_g4604 [Phytophthora cactorum]KAG2840722.1 hypothetical protein PC112_g3626 [Phytophthora cactorum]KAG2863093.1 hypothetical protein PC113_g5718 [Phytophthora cactorum]KAG2932377.1 hypothetical protein PC115_g5795 [Phytophthora cactorum]
MKRERSPSFPTLPSLNSSRSVAVCRPQQDHVMVHKRLRNSSSFNKSNVARNGNGHGAASNSYNYSSSVVCQQTPITPTSTSAAPPATLMQFADFYVDPSAVSPAEAVSLAEEMAADFYSEVSIMYDMLSDIKTPTAEGRAVDELMRRLHNVLSAHNNGRTAGGGNQSTQIANVRGLYNGVIRVFIFLYQRYYRAFVVLEVNELLAASWQRLLAFVVEYRILDEVFVRKVYDHVAQIVGSS